MRIIISGQSGLDKTDFTEKLKQIIQSKSHDVTVYHIGKLICKKLNINEKKILNLKLNYLDAYRQIIFLDIFKEIAEKNPENIIVNTHHVFRWQNALFPAFNMEQLSTLKPNMFISLIDDVYSVYARLKKSRPEINYTLKDIMVWREEEMIVADILAKMYNCPHFVLSINYGPEIVYKLMFESHLPKIYTSFPISLILDKPKTMEEVSKFRKWVSDNAIAFDPYCAIQEKRLDYELHKAKDKGEEKIIITALGNQMEFNLNDVSQIIDDINGQIIYRDFRLIDQSDMVLAFIPTIDGTPQISSGVERELEYGRENGKDVYIICDAVNRLSPFVTTRCDHIFKSFDEAKKQLFPDK